jgi:hypothetical protein
VGEDHVLDFNRGDVLTARDDDVLLPVGETEESVVADHPAVTGMEPSSGERPVGVFGLLPVTGEHRVGAGEDLTVGCGTE